MPVACQSRAPECPQAFGAASRDLPHIIPRGMPGARSLRARLMRVGEQEQYAVQLVECSIPSSGPSGHLPTGEGIRGSRGRADEGIGPYKPVDRTGVLPIFGSPLSFLGCI